MQKNEIWFDYKIDSGSYQCFTFSVDKRQEDFKIFFDFKVDGDGLDINFILCTYEDGQKLIKWVNDETTEKCDSHGNVVKDKDGYPVKIAAKPQVPEFFRVKTNILRRELYLSPGKYTLFFDNVDSVLTEKNLFLHIIKTWDVENTRQDLSIMEHLVDEMPKDIMACIKDANDCYTSGHYNQCSIMLRKVIEIAIKIKLLQSELNSTQLLDKAGNEIGLSSKIKILKEKKLIRQKSLSDIEQVKWFGDIGAHGTMRVTGQDIRDNIDPKIRSFLVGLNLKV